MEATGSLKPYPKNTISRDSFALSLNKSDLLLVFLIAVASLVSEYVVLLLLLLYCLYNEVVKENDLASVLVLIVASELIPMGAAISLLILILARIYKNNGARINKKIIKYMCGISLWLLLTSFLWLDYRNLDNLFYNYFIKNTYKEYFYPMLLGFYVILVKKGIVEFFNGSIKAYLVCGLAAVAPIMIGVKPAITFHSQLLFPLVILFCGLLSKKNAVFLIVSVASYAIMITQHQAIINSQEVLYFFAMIIVMLTHNLNLRSLVYAFVVFSILVIVSTNIDFVYQSIKALFPSVSWLAFKITQAFYLVNIFDFEALPWSLRIRIAETLQVFEKNPAAVFVGSGLYSYITDLSQYAIVNPNEFFGDNDYSAAEIASNRFYGLHNTSRGLLHYGVLYFLLVFYYHYKLKNKVNSLAASWTIVGALINPSIVFLILMRYTDLIGIKYVFRKKNR
jgi:hypothetical protein